MPHDRLSDLLSAELREMEAAGRRKGVETVFAGVVPPSGAKGPRYLVAGEGDKPFLRMNANNYLGMARRPEVIAAEETAAPPSPAIPARQPGGRRPSS